jgi:L-iditol 2-dehydrogenase
MVIEASGDVLAASQALAAPRKGGRTVVVGFPPSPTQVDLFALAVAEHEVIGSLSHVWDEDFRAAVGLLERGLMTADQMVSARIPLEETVSFGFERDDWKALPGAKVLVSPQL